MSRKIFQWVGSLLLGGFSLFLLLALISYLKPKERWGEALSLPTPSPTSTPSPWENITLDQIRFGEPRVVLTGALGLRIVGWISNDEVLILRDLTPGRTREAIEVFNVKTGEVERLAEGRFLGKPIWNKKAIIYIHYDAVRKEGDLIWQPLGGKGGQKLASDVLPPIVLVKEGAVAYDEKVKNLRGRFMVYEEKESIIPFGPFAPLHSPTAYGCMYRTEISPDGKWQVVYNCEHFLLMDTKEGVIKELDLGTEMPEGKGFPRWAMDSQWSPDGKKLAIVASIGDFLPRRTQLLLIEPWTEEIREIERPRNFILSEVDWAPGGRLLLVSGLEAISEGTFLPRMWLVDIKLERMRDLASFPVARSEDPRGGAAWSPDGKHLIFYCRPKSASGSALCLASVEVER